MKHNQENRIMSMWRVRALALVLSIGAPLASWAQNAIQSITSTQQAGSEVVRIELSEALAQVPPGFSVQTPPRVAIVTTSTAGIALRSLLSSLWTLAT